MQKREMLCDTASCVGEQKMMNKKFSLEESFDKKFGVSYVGDVCVF